MKNENEDNNFGITPLTEAEKAAMIGPQKTTDALHLKILKQFEALEKKDGFKIATPDYTEGANQTEKDFEFAKDIRKFLCDACPNDGNKVEPLKDGVGGYIKILKVVKKKRTKKVAAE
jgi:hypothetical protein